MISLLTHSMDSVQTCVVRIQTKSGYNFFDFSDTFLYAFALVFRGIVKTYVFSPRVVLLSNYTIFEGTDFFV